MSTFESMIVKPLLTEKASLASEQENKYGFLVKKNFNKNQIKEAIEKLYDVKVLNVHTSIMPGKLKRYGRKVKKSAALKKAYVKLEQGQKIEFFKGV